MMLHSNRKEVEQQIEEIIDEVSVQDLMPSVALRQIMYFLDIYAHKQKLIGMQEIADLYRNGGKDMSDDYYEANDKLIEQAWREHYEQRDKERRNANL
jgi:acetolactate synthase small subunit